MPESFTTISWKKNKIKATLTKQELETYWKNIWERDSTHNSTAPWIQQEYENTANISRMEWEKITEEELKAAIRTTANWKASGGDGIPNYWLKKLHATHKNLTTAYNEVMNEKQNIPEWLTKGRTYLIPKDQTTEMAKSYRPITCLNNVYKLLTKILSERLYYHLEKNKLFPAEQKGCAKNTYGCKDHLITSKMLNKDCKERKKNMSLAWIDYKKAFDKVPHTWIIESLNIYRASPTLLSFISRTMNNWITDMYLIVDPKNKNSTSNNITKETADTSGNKSSSNSSSNNNNNVIIENIHIKRGIYQGDSMSPLLFCLALFPLSSRLNNTTAGYQCKHEREKVNHLLYVDDLKLVAKSDEELAEQLAIVKNFSDDIGMEFGLDKCAKASFIKGRLQEKQHIKIDTSTTIKSLDQTDTYKYLGIDEHDGVQHKKMKMKIRKEYLRRTREILKTELNAKNKITAMTALAIPVIQYSVDIIKWTQAEIRKLDTQTRKLMTMYGALHPRADIDRLYIPRKEGGRGLISIESTYNIAKKGLANYLKLKEKEKYLGMVFRYMQNQQKEKEDSTSEDIENARENCKTDKSETERVKEMKQQWKQQIKEERKNKWKSKPLHGQLPKEAEKEMINTAQTWAWLSYANLKTETEALITACQDQAIATKYMKARIMKTESDQKCRLCRLYNETIHHIVSGCPILAKKAYLDRHNTVAKQLHWNICKKYNIDVSDKWYEHDPAPVVDSPEVTIMWDTQIQTDRKIVANKPDLVVKDKQKRYCLLIDVSIPSDYNIANKEAEKQLKYKDLQIEIQRMWNLKTKVIPVIIGATGLISKTTAELIKEVPGRHNLLQMQRAVVLSTAHIVRKVL